MTEAPVATKTLLLLFGFVLFSAGALVVPLLGVVGYVVHYHFWPDNHWWGKAISSWNLRYAFTIGLCLLVGTVLNKHKLKLGGTVMKKHEWLLVLFWATAVLSLFTGIDLPFDSYQRAHQHNLLDKVSKVILFCLLMSHVVTTLRRYDILLWTLIIGTLYVGYEAWSAPMWKFTRARLQGIGGPDFRESSFLGAHFAIMLPLIGVQFLRGGWKARLICALAGGFAVNGLVLTRTRAAFLGVCVGMLAALLFGLRGRRRRIFLYLLPGLLLGAYLTDAGFRDRMKTISPQPEPTDTSAHYRLLIWEAGGRMFVDNPLGVGIGNFRVMLSTYSEKLIRRDAHNTFIRCATELGVFGAAALGLLMLSAITCLARARRYALLCPDSWQIRYYCYGTGVSLAVMFTTSFFMSQLYIEVFWWVLTLPVCVLRAAELEYLRAAAEEEAWEEAPAAAEEHPAEGGFYPGNVGWA